MSKQSFLLWLAVGVWLVSALSAVMASPAAALSFAPAVHYGLGGRPADLASADLNGDGLADLVASAGNGIDVLLGRGLGRFAPAVRVPLEHRPGAIALTDVNADGAVDVVAASLDGTVSVLLGDGHGAFVLKGAFPAGTNAPDVAVGDLTADGVPDVAAANGDGLSILAGDGTGGLLSPLHLAVGEGCSSIVSVDFNLDGALDLAFTRNSSDSREVVVLFGDGAGGFPRMTIVEGYRVEISRLVPCSLNRDGLPDLATLEALDGEAVIGTFLGDGLGVFVQATGTMISRDMSAWGLAAGDLNGDGRADVVTTGYEHGGTMVTSDGRRVTLPDRPPRIYIMLSHVLDGVFHERTSFLAGRLSGELIVADLNGDRSLDLATTDPEARSLSVRMNGLLPRLTGLSPARGHVGDVVTLTGRRFGRSGVVKFGGTTVTAYLSWDRSKIKVRVPAGTPKGSVKVTVRTSIGRSAPMSFVRL